MGSERTGIDEKQLHSWNLLGEFSRLLEKAGSGGNAPAGPAGGPRRLLSEHDYLRAFLFAQFNPVIDSARGLCAASDLKRVQEEVCTRHISLGSSSEAQSVFGTDLLERVFTGLVRTDPDAIKGPGSRQARLLAIDSTVIAAVPRMDWAEWRHQKKTQRAVRLHLKFNVLDGEPVGALTSEGRECERAAFARMLSAGEFYVGDRNYGRDYGLLAAMEEKGCGYAVRMCASANFTVREELAISPEDRAAGVVSDRLVNLGARARWQHGPVRLVVVDREELDEPVIIATNRLDPESHPGALIAEIYRSRWRIELFFRWFKCVLGRSAQWHWMAESRDGTGIQIYSMLIAALLLAAHNGKLPTKRQMEMLRFHAMGMAELEEIAPILGLAKRRPGA